MEAKKDEELEQVEAQVDNLNDLIYAKNKMLDDKNEEISELKDKIADQNNEFEVYLKENNIKTL